MGGPAPAFVAVDAAGNVFAAEPAGDQVQKFDNNGNLLLTWGSHGSGLGQFDEPFGIGVGPSGHVYVADAINNRIQMFDNDGHFLLAWGSTDAHSLIGPEELAVDRVGDVFASANAIGEVVGYGPLTFPVTVTKPGAGSGTVTSAPPGSTAAPRARRRLTATARWT